MNFSKYLLVVGTAALLAACGEQQQTVATNNLDPNKVTSLDEKTLRKFGQMTSSIVDDGGALDYLGNNLEKLNLEDIDQENPDPEAIVNLLVDYYKVLNGDVPAVFVQGNYQLPERFSELEFYTNVCLFPQDDKEFEVLVKANENAMGVCVVAVSMVTPFTAGLSREEIYSINALSQKDYMTAAQWQAIVENKAGFTYIAPNQDYLLKLGLIDSDLPPQGEE